MCVKENISPISTRCPQSVEGRALIFGHSMTCLQNAFSGDVPSQTLPALPPCACSVLLLCWICRVLRKL